MPCSQAPLRPVYRVCAFVIPDYLEAVMKAVREVDPLRNGEYEGVTWRSSRPGIESFWPTEAASPTYGEAGKLSEVPATRIEFSLPRNECTLARVLEALSEAHPWERPVIIVTEALEWNVTRQKE